MDTVDDVLEHFGIKGMKWGQRRAAIELNRSPESKQARETMMIIKKKGVSAVSNKDLQALVTRMNLEQQYAGLHDRNNKNAWSRVEAGQKRARAIIGVGKTMNDAYQFANSPLARTLISGMGKSKKKGPTRSNGMVKPSSPTRTYEPSGYL